MSQEVPESLGYSQDEIDQAQTQESNLLTASQVKHLNLRAVTLRVQLNRMQYSLDREREKVAELQAQLDELCLPQSDEEGPTPTS